MHKSYNKFLWENAIKTNKHTNELHILHQNAKKKINILKIGSNKKNG
jgi:hypothetical protein